MTSTLAPHPSTLAPQADPAPGLALQMMESLAVPAFVLDLHCKVLVWNRACERLTGVSAREMVGTASHGAAFYQPSRPTLADLLIRGRVHDLPGWYARHEWREQQTLCAENWCDMPRAGAGAARRYLAADASPIFGNDGSIIAVVQTMRDITDEKRARNALERLATRDSLTGLANRRCFDDTLRAEWQRALRQQQALSLLMVDVDNFRRYNETFGHPGGDSCLQRVAEAMAAEMRSNDLVARYGGEEFAVLLPNQSLKGAAIVAERIRQRIEQLRLPCLKNGAACVTVSIGAATALPGIDTQAAQLVATADAALYRAKHMGRNRISLPEHEVRKKTP